MAQLNFCIPRKLDELLINDIEKYCVYEVIVLRDLNAKLKDAKLGFKEQGPEYVLDYFDTYYSVLHHGEKLSLDDITTTWEDLHKACVQLNNTVAFLLDDPESLDDEVKTKYLTVMKMLVFLYSKIVRLIDQKVNIKLSENVLMKGRKKKQSEDGFNFKDKELVLLMFDNLVQRELHLFWDPPMAEESFVDAIAEVCYRFLDSPHYKSDKELQTVAFHLLGKLLKNYNLSVSFTIRIAQIIKLREHMVSIIPFGFKILIEEYQCKGLIQHFVRELTEWQTEESYQDSQGTKNCSNVLIELAISMPDLMIPEMMYLMTYLNHESHMLRIAVLSIITEMIFKVFTANELSDEQKETRDEFLEVLEDHTADMSGIVRAKVFQNWAKLQQENAVPIKNQFSVLEKAVEHLRDKAAAVRKSAANLITTFVQCNIYAATLNMAELHTELETETTKYNTLKSETENLIDAKLNEVKAEWIKKENAIRSLIQIKLANPELLNITTSELNMENIGEIVKLYINECKYDEAFHLVISFQETHMKNARDGMSEEKQLAFFMELIQKMFITPTPQESAPHTNLSAEQIRNIEELERNLNYLNDATKFVRLVESAIVPMKSLVTSATVSDMHEAVEFFVVAFKFAIKGAIDGILHMLKYMRGNDPDRKNVIVTAYKKIYLETDAKTSGEHTTIIIGRLIDLIKSVTFEYYNDVTSIVAEWVSKGMLDNLIIQGLWQTFNMADPSVSHDDSRIALKLLTMAAKGRKTIISKNINVVVASAFGDRALNDLKLFEEACRIIAVAGHDKIDVSDPNPCFRIDSDEEMWTKLIDVLVITFTKKIYCWNKAATAAVSLVFKLCRIPEKICSELVKRIMNLFKCEESKLIADGKVEIYILAQLVHLIGEISIHEFTFLDVTVYKELKRRQYIREEKQQNNKNNKQKNRSYKATASSKQLNSSCTSVCSVDEPQDDESIMGAVADDNDADFILRVCENDIVTSNLLGTFAPLLVKMCQEQDVYSSEVMQSTSVLALLRFMAISSRLCSKNLQLVFTLLEKTQYPTVKINILIALADLLCRFPNIIEPWTPRMYARLRDPSYVVRRTALLVLTRLILCDMIRMKGYIAEMGLCIVDPEVELQEISKQFFVTMSKKGNNLYNVIPDVLSRLTDSALNIEEQDFQIVMKFILGLIDKDKQMESLVERLCMRFKIAEEDRHCRDIAYCLSLIQYNEKTLGKLIDRFSMYKEKLHIDSVYQTFKGILSTCSKSAKLDVKRLADELEQRIESAFDIHDDNNENQNPNVSRSLMPPPRRPIVKKAGRIKGRKVSNKNSDDEAEDLQQSFTNDDLSASTASKRSMRTKSRKVCVPIASDSDSDD